MAEQKEPKVEVFTADDGEKGLRVVPQEGHSQPKITIIQADDWGGIYVDGKLWTEGHSTPRHEWVRLLELVGAPVTDLSETPEAYAAIEAIGRCPTEWPPKP